MEDVNDYIELPIDLEEHSWFMYVVSKFDVEVEIIKGMYRISYKNPKDLFDIGKQVARNPNTNFYSHVGWPK
jgi:hypothetical protein